MSQVALAPPVPSMQASVVAPSSPPSQPPPSDTPLSTTSSSSLASTFSTMFGIGKTSTPNTGSSSSVNSERQNMSPSGLEEFNANNNSSHGVNNENNRGHRPQGEINPENTKDKETHKYSNNNIKDASAFHIYDKSGENSTANNIVDTNKRMVDVPHLKQYASWDCGVACAAMCLRARGHPEMSLKRVMQSLRELGVGTSVWTIDLMFALCDFLDKSMVRYTTTFLGVQDSHAALDFYEDSIEEDTVRVRQRFREAQTQKYNVDVVNETTEAIVAHIANGGLVIALLDMNSVTNGLNKIRATFAKMVDRVLNQPASFAGHYVVLCGFDRAKSRLYYRDPSGVMDMYYMPFVVFENGRNHPGTDGDLLFIS